MDMQPIRGAEGAAPLKPVKDAKSARSAGESTRATRGKSLASGSGQVETENARVKALVKQLVDMPDDRADQIATAQERLESGFFHSEEGLRATAERLLGPPE